MLSRCRDTIAGNPVFLQEHRARFEPRLQPGTQQGYSSPSTQQPRARGLGLIMYYVIICMYDCSIRNHS